MKSRLALTLISALVLCSCNGDRVELWDDYDCVVDRSGVVENYEIHHGKPFVVTVMTIQSIYSILGDTPKGKIDDIIEDNPEWEFVFYCACQYSESSELQQVLEDYDCNFPVIVDPKKKMWKTNRLDGVEAISLICGKNGDSSGFAVIGASLSPFDSVFAKAKERHHLKIH